MGIPKCKIYELQAIWAINAQCSALVCIETRSTVQTGSATLITNILITKCGRALQGVGLRPLACWNCGIESHGGMEVCFGCCVLSRRVASATGRSLLQRSPAQCVVFQCESEASVIRQALAHWGRCRAMTQKIMFIACYVIIKF